MAYLSKDELVAAISDERITQALDDNRDGQEDSGLWAAISAEVDAWINGYLEQAGLSEPDPVPGRLKHAALRYAEYRLYYRRKLPERAKEVYDQWIKPAMAWLEKVATGQESILPKDDDEAEAAADGGLVSEDSRMPSDGRLMI